MSNIKTAKGDWFKVEWDSVLNTWVAESCGTISDGFSDFESALIWAIGKMDETLTSFDKTGTQIP